MGGFLLVKSTSMYPEPAGLPAHQAALQIFLAKGMRTASVVVREQFELHLFQKIAHPTEQLLIQQNGDFAATTGTLIYDGLVGKAALTRLFADLQTERNIQSALSGHYALIIWYKGTLTLLNDYLGQYRVFVNKTGTIFSNSFLAAASAAGATEMADQEVYEYLFHGATHGDKTILRDINLLPSQQMWQLVPAWRGTTRQIAVGTFPQKGRFAEIVDHVAQTAAAHYQMLRLAFSGPVTSALSGGYDSRMMLALARQVDWLPRLYVYGKENSQDVKIAKMVTAGEGIPLDHINRAQIAKPTIDSFPEILRQNWLMYDGVRNVGVFTDGTDLITRRQRTEDATLQLNGGGGEIYRDYWGLPNGRFTIRQLMWAKYDFVDYRLCTSRFSKQAYFAILGRKMRTALNDPPYRLTRTHINRLYPYFRLKYWMAINSSVNQQFTYAILPYIDPKLVEQSLLIPTRFKLDGQFQAALIARLDEKLARYPSQYGHDFYNPIPWGKRLRLQFKRAIPTSLRPLLRQRYRKINRDIPFYLQPDFVRKLLGVERLLISSYVDVERLIDGDMLSRAFSLELFLQKQAGHQLSMLIAGE